MRPVDRRSLPASLTGWPPVCPGRSELYSRDRSWNCRIRGGIICSGCSLDSVAFTFSRIEAGLTPKAQPYAGWESEDVWGVGPLRGGFMGCYLSGLSLMYRATGDRTPAPAAGDTPPSGTRSLPEGGRRRSYHGHCRRAGVVPACGSPERFGPTIRPSTGRGLRFT
ncbi:MAG: beta-L-arabinofuranosidase domain-containing protein [Alistipes shahii]|uniref:beta-L-arabinofuranosidase domain-containing protein n=1 Tax=Alistipes shahii TaxID=328814 RepID=UPI00399D5593